MPLALKEEVKATILEESELVDQEMPFVINFLKISAFREVRCEMQKPIF